MKNSLNHFTNNAIQTPASIQSSMTERQKSTFNQQCQSQISTHQEQTLSPQHPSMTMVSDIQHSSVSRVSVICDQCQTQISIQQEQTLSPQHPSVSMVCNPQRPSVTGNPPLKRASVKDTEEVSYVVHRGSRVAAWSQYHNPASTASAVQGHQQNVQPSQALLVPEHHSEQQLTLLFRQAHQSRQEMKRKKKEKIEEDSRVIFFRGNMIKEKYQIICSLGIGAFGKTVECVDLSKNRMRAAMKTIKPMDAKAKDFALQEVRMLQLINNFDIEKKCHCVQILDSFDYYGHICIVLELLGESTHDFLKKNGFKPLPVDHIRHMAKQIFTAVHFLHRNKIVHTNLKPEKILFVINEMTYDPALKQFMRTPKGLNVKLTDFGNSVFICQNQTGLVTTQPYRAPEVILDLGWNNACDVWSLGCVLMEYYLGCPLFQALDNLTHMAMMEQVLGLIPTHMLQATRKKHHVKHGRLAWDENSFHGTLVKEKYKLINDYMYLRRVDHIQLFDLIRNMLEYDVSNRITMEEALQHPFFVHLEK